MPIPIQFIRRLAKKILPIVFESYKLLIYFSLTGLKITLNAITLFGANFFIYIKPPLRYLKEGKQIIVENIA